jgi:S-adenosylmethionine decarboxylase
MQSSDSKSDSSSASYDPAKQTPGEGRQAPPGSPGVLGWHLILELYECDAGRLDDLAAIQSYLMSATRASGATILDQRFHKFSPQGVSGVIVIAESHVSIHTWPEHGYAAVDYFSCSPEMNSESLTESLQKFLASGRVKARTIERGFVD